MKTIASENITPRRLAGLEIFPVERRAPYLNILIYGDSGVGKTTLAGSSDAVPAMRPVLIVDIEGGTESLRRPFPDVDVVRVKNWTEMNDLYNELYDGKSGYQTVVLDSLTEIQKFSMYKIMERLMELEPSRDPDVPSMREWGKNLEQTRKFVRGFRDLPMHTIFTALSKGDKNPRTGITTLKPSLNGKAADEVAAFLDVVAYYYVKEVAGDDGEVEQARLLLTQKTEEQVAKDRSGKLPMVIQNPTMAMLFDFMNNTTESEPETEKTETPKKGK